MGGFYGGLKINAEICCNLPQTSYNLIMDAKYIEMSEFEIASKIKHGKTFSVKTNRERKKALAAAKFVGKQVTTSDNGSGFNVQFVNP